MAHTQGVRQSDSLPALQAGNPRSTRGALTPRVSAKGNGNVFDAKKVFLGVPRSAARSYVSNVARKFYRGAVPFAGSFSAAASMVPSIPASRVKNTDISLFSGILGYWLTDRPMSDLGIQIHEPDLAGLYRDATTERDRAALALLAMKVGQFREDHPHEGQLRREALENVNRHVGTIGKELDRAHELLKGVHYESMDGRVLLNEALQWRDGLVFVDAPWYNKGYAKMFNVGHVISWKAPEVAEFQSNEFPKMLADLESADAAVLFYVNHSNLADMPNHRLTMCHMEAQDGVPGYVLLTNRKDFPRGVTRNRIKKPFVPKIPVVERGQRVEAKSRIALAKLDRQHAEHYKSLMARKMSESTLISENYAFVIDGKLANVMGIATDHARQKGGRHAFVMYHITATWAEPNLSRFLEKLLLTTETRDTLMTLTNVHPFDPAGLRTRTFSRTPYTKALRGLYELVEKDQRDDGIWTLLYEGEWREKRWSGVVNEWVQQRDKPKKDNAAE